MEIIQVDLTKDFSSVIEKAVTTLRKGGTVVYPTDTLYGLGANALDASAIQKVFAIKRRDRTRPLPMIVRNIAWVKELAFIEPHVEEFLKKVWPAPVTVILNKMNRVPDVLTGGGRTVGIRVPNHPFADMLLSRFGYPITSTSANISDAPSSPDPTDIARMFQSQFYQPDLMIDAGVLPASEPSTVIDCTGKEPKILRIGPAKPQELMKLLKI